MYNKFGGIQCGWEAFLPEALRQMRKVNYVTSFFKKNINNKIKIIYACSKKLENILKVYKRKTKYIYPYH